jgi:two-component system, chemotaxis family, protein-glutamate methylesterase/glutaminase
MHTERRIRVLVVDDSMLIRALLVKGLSSDAAIEVVGTAQDPYEARDRIEQLDPDVMTCDVEMPRMDGVTFIRKLLPQHPMPVIVVSTISEAIFDALAAGAVDFVTKPRMDAVDEVERFIIELIRKVKAAAKSNHRRSTEQTSVGIGAGIRDREYGQQDDVIVVGASTGGTEAIHQLLSRLPARMPGIAIVQHIPPGFSRMFAERMNATTPFQVKEASSGDILSRGTVCIAPGDKHMRLVKAGGQYVVRCETGEKVSGHLPSVDVLFESAAKLAGSRVIGVLLTGMGYDGAKGMLAIRRRGGRTVGQDAASSVIYGMPRAAYELGAVEYQLPLHAIASRICALLS